MRLWYPHACEVGSILLLPIAGGASSYFLAVWAGALLQMDAYVEEEDSAARRMPQHQLTRKLSGSMMALLVALQLAMLQVVGAAFRQCGTIPLEIGDTDSHHYAQIHIPARYLCPRLTDSPVLMVSCACPPELLQQLVRAGGRVHTPSRVAPPVGAPPAAARRLHLLTSSHCALYLHRTGRTGHTRTRRKSTPTTSSGTNRQLTPKETNSFCLTARTTTADSTAVDGCTISMFCHRRRRWHRWYRMWQMRRSSSVCRAMGSLGCSG